MKLVSATGDRFDNDASKIERQRQKNRLHQASYKMRQRKLVAGLEDSLKKLKEEIPELESQQRVLSYGQTNATIWSIAAEYFRLFRHGVKHSVVSTTGKESLLTYKTPKSSQFQAQWHFMETAMAHDICNGVVSGIQALMDNLIFLSKCYEEFDLRPLRMDNVSENVLNVTTRCEIIITENTLRYGFPDLIKNGKHSSLAGKILGEKIIVNGSMRFVRDNMSGQITRLQWKSDLLTPLLRLFGSLEAVSRLFNGAQLSPDGNISPFVIGPTDS
ncbi:hypothetical protein L914_12467 [Phytophthora nicotianae]|uniref:BZIP domain-containing protein n=1 Tax=Phytophthora nicotianae TaxID=4792 RepID=W2N264_PHYNI|nr:hypothetical protein L914_12467 [Phytophthora nicotianae]